MFIISCKTANDKIALDPATEKESEILQEGVIADIDTSFSSTKSLFPAIGAAGDQEQFWMQAFKACFDDGMTARNSIFNKTLIYMGPSSNKYLGTIIDSKGRTRRSLASLIPMSDFKLFTDTGVIVNNCDLTRIKKMSIDFVVGGSYGGSMDANLAAAFNSADSTIITGGSWKKDDFRIDDFLDYINESKDEKIIKYRKTLIENGNKVITLVYKVNGFSAKSFLSRDLSVELQAKLRNSIELKAPGSDSTNASVKFSSSTNKEINISSTNSFYIFANVWVGKKLKK